MSQEKNVEINFRARNLCNAFVTFTFRNNFFSDWLNVTFFKERILSHIFSLKILVSE